MPPPADNIALFEEYAATLFARLYTRFPEKISLDALALAGETELDEFGGAGPRGRIARETIDWLRSEGYLAADMLPHGAHNARLTEKGLAALRRVPEAVRGDLPLGERLRRLAAAGAREALSETLRHILRHHAG